jgi:hypothetical protein
VTGYIVNAIVGGAIVVSSLAGFVSALFPRLARTPLSGGGEVEREDVLVLAQQRAQLVDGRAWRFGDGF